VRNKVAGENVCINGREISRSSRPYVIAEVSANHNGSLQRALETIKAAKEAGVDAVKIQTYTPETMTIPSSKEDFLIKDGLWKDRTLFDLYGEAYTPYEWHDEIFTYARKIGVTLFSSPFDETAVDLLEKLDTPAYKVASFELVDLPLIEYIAKKKKPMLMSTGMASLEEVGDAIETARSNGCNQLAIFHCISSYPAPIDQANINNIPFLRKEFGVEVGLSDHTLGNVASIVATTVGASLVEKHFTLDRSEGGVDSAFSLEPDEMKELVKVTSDAFSALGNGDFKRSKAETENMIFRRSLYFVEDLKKGEVIASQHIRRIRPGFGLSPKYLPEIIGSTMKEDVTRGDRVTFEKIALPEK
jgi:N-acetylneuraminate synthase